MFYVEQLTKFYGDMSGQRVPAKIDKLLLFNSSWPQKEGEEINKLIYYYTSRVRNEDDTSCEFSDEENGLLNCAQEELKDAVNAMGLCEAIVNFVKNFGKDEEVYSVHGNKIRLSMMEVEKNYWLGLSLYLPKTLASGATGKPDSDEDYTYHDADLNDHLVQIVIKEIYETFYLFHGNLEGVWQLSGKNLSSFRDVCGKFFLWFLLSLELSTLNMGELFGAIQSLTLDSETSQAVQNLTEDILSSDACCKHTMFLYNAQLVSSNLDLVNTYIIYRYLVSTVIPEVSSEEISESVVSKVSRKTRYLRKGQKIYLKEEASHYLMNVYRSFNGATMVILLDSSVNDRLEDVLVFCDQAMSQKIPELANKLSKIYVEELTTQTSMSSNNSKYDPQYLPDFFRYAICDRKSATYKTNAGYNGIFDLRKTAEHDFLKPIIDLESDLRCHLSKNNPEDSVEIIAKTTSDSWLTVNEADLTTLFSSLNHKNDNLVDAADAISAHVKKRLLNS